VWEEQTIRERFAWNEESCLQVALVRVYRLPVEAAVWSFPYASGYGGCRSWVKLPAEGKVREGDLTPVMEDAAWGEVACGVRQALGEEP
jgi:hypothetical protein